MPPGRLGASGAGAAGLGGFDRPAARRRWKLSAVIPMNIVSNSDTAPRTTGSDSGFTARHGFRTGAACGEAAVRAPTATAMREGERIMTRPMMTAAADGQGVSGSPKKTGSERDVGPPRSQCTTLTVVRFRSLTFGACGSDPHDRPCPEVLPPREERVARRADVEVNLAVARRGLECRARLPPRPQP